MVNNWSSMASQQAARSFQQEGPNDVTKPGSAVRPTFDGYRESQNRDAEFEADRAKAIGTMDW